MSAQLLFWKADGGNQVIHFLELQGRKSEAPANDLDHGQVLIRSGFRIGIKVPVFGALYLLDRLSTGQVKGGLGRRKIQEFSRGTPAPDMRVAYAPLWPRSQRESARYL